MLLIHTNIDYYCVFWWQQETKRARARTLQPASNFRSFLTNIVRYIKKKEANAVRIFLALIYLVYYY